MLRRLMSNRLIQGLAVALVISVTVGSAFAWQTVTYGFEHSNRYGGEANSGNRAGAVEYSGSERRVRAGAEYISFTQSEINWNINNGYPAIVFHISPANQEGGICTNIRTVLDWNWTNLPGAKLTSKGCGPGTGYNGNEMRFYYTASAVSASSSYYTQSLYRDTGYNGTQASKTTGQIGFDSYTTDVFGIRQNSDFHGKVCIWFDSTYASTNGLC